MGTVIRSARSEPKAVRPSKHEAEQAREVVKRLRPALAGDEDGPTATVRLVLEEGGGHEVAFELPASTVALIHRLLSETAAGHAVAIHPVPSDLSTQEAADLLGVSRPFLIGLTDRGEIPCRRVGKHRRILHEDVMSYKGRVDAERARVLDELVAEAQQLDMGY